MSALASSCSMRARSAPLSGSSSSTRLLTLKACHGGELRSLPGPSSLTTSAPRSARMRPASQPSRSVASMTKVSERSIAAVFGTGAANPYGVSPPAARQRMDPPDHPRARVLDILLGEEVLGLDPI